MVKILVIEDDAEIVEFMSIAFSTAWPAVEMISTHHGKEGIDLVKTQQPDAVLLDLGLPDISGFDVLKRIRAFSEVPVIIESVRGSEYDVANGLSCGADEYIVKPFGQLELVARVKAVCRSFATPDGDGSR
jgi:two-component system response regulator VicR